MHANGVNNQWLNILIHMHTHLVFHAVAQSAFTNKMARVKLHSSLGSVM